MSVRFALLGILAAALLSGCGPLFGEDEDCSSDGYIKHNCVPVEWSNLPVMIALDGSSSPDSPAALSQAISVWEQSTGINLFEMGASSHVIIFGSAAEATAAGMTATEPAKTFLVHRGGIIQDADIRLNRDLPLTTQQPVGLGQVDLTSIFVHELGHVLGLDHDNSLDPEKSVMNSQISGGELRYRLSARDIERIQRLYR